RDDNPRFWLRLGAYDPLLHARCPNWPAPRRRCDGARCRSLAADQSLVPLFPRSRLAPVAPAREKLRPDLLVFRVFPSFGAGSRPMAHGVPAASTPKRSLVCDDMAS